MTPEAQKELNEKRLKERGFACFEIIPWCPHCGASFSTPVNYGQEDGIKTCEDCAKPFKWETEITCSATPILGKGDSE